MVLRAIADLKHQGLFISSTLRAVYISQLTPMPSLTQRRLSFKHALSMNRLRQSWSTFLLGVRLHLNCIASSNKSTTELYHNGELPDEDAIKQITMQVLVGCESSGFVITATGPNLRSGGGDVQLTATERMLKILSVIRAGRSFVLLRCHKPVTHHLILKRKSFARIARHRCGLAIH